MTNYEPESDYGVKSPKTTKRVLTQTGNLLRYLPPDPINAGVNLDLGRSCPEAFFSCS